ncbi:hypothetical protein KBI52_12255 [Microvirga sp. HBU67558]|uniref:hypothetical protein n=1 Tax=Microvirga sp. HBU67558 TaxID=2824562 RepID=UPI001B368E1A|nr:hypothetical protein [Microvirga sp. HBU67558]MBQ0820979.1 hypothetical protein [Microvirga sp. HBU67558]
MAKTKAAKATKANKDPKDLMAKAQRRGEKLHRTLSQIIAQTKLDKGHPAHVLLKALEKSLGRLHDHGEVHNRSGGEKSAKRVKPSKEEAPATSAKPARAARSSKARKTRVSDDVPVIKKTPASEAAIS